MVVAKRTWRNNIVRIAVPRIVLRIVGNSTPKLNGVRVEKLARLPTLNWVDWIMHLSWILYSEIYNKAFYVMKEENIIIIIIIIIIIC